VVDHQSPIVEGEKIAGGDAVHPVVRCVRSVPASVEHAPPVWLLQRPGRIDILVLSRGLGRQEGGTYVRHPIQSVVLPIARVKSTGTHSLNFNVAGRDIPEHFLQFGDWQRFFAASLSRSNRTWPQSEGDMEHSDEINP